MILILMSWMYILFTAVTLGMVLNTVLRISNTNFVITSFFGLFTATLVGGFWALFYRINWEFHVVLIILNLLFFFWQRKSLKNLTSKFFTEIVSFPKHFKILITLICVIILVKSAQTATVIDNESYYIQTIKWLNEYGFVSGLANLHLYLAQQSGIHITQAVFNFSFLTKNLNDINGLILLLANLFALSKLTKYNVSSRTNNIVMGLLPVTNIILLEFIGAPSPDLPIYVLTFIIVFYFIEHLENENANYLIHIVLLCIFAVFIKITSVALLLSPLIILGKNPKLFRHTPILIILSSSVFVLFLIKNFIVSGHPIYPISWTPVTAKFAVPSEIINTNFYRYKLTASAFESISNIELFKHWLMMPKVHGLFNIIGFALIFLVPIYLKIKKLSASWYFIYFIMAAQFVLLAYFSLQFRFFLNFILLFGVLLFGTVISSRKFQLLAIYAVTFISLILVFVPKNYTFSSAKKTNLESSSLTLRNIVLPQNNSALKPNYEKQTLHNLQYFAPVDTSYFWKVGNGPLPCVTQLQIKYFKTKFGYIPQPLTNNIKDGFYSKKVEISE